jgi:hypothetical protein
LAPLNIKSPPSERPKKPSQGREVPLLRRHQVYVCRDKAATLAACGLSPRYAALITTNHLEARLHAVRGGWLGDPATSHFPPGEVVALVHSGFTTVRLERASAVPCQRLTRLTRLSPINR